MKMSEQFAGNYFKAADLPQPRVLTIQAVTQEKMPEGDAKPVMRFVGEQQQLVLNKTNAFCCVEMFGDETAAWAGQQVELYATTKHQDGKQPPHQLTASKHPSIMPWHSGMLTTSNSWKHSRQPRRRGTHRQPNQQRKDIPSS